LKARGRVVWGLAGLLGVAGLAIARVWVPPEGIASSVCLFRRVLAIPCPLCGMTRAFAHLAKGEWAAALADHPLAPLAAAELAAAWLAWGAVLAGWLPARRPPWLGDLLLAQAGALCALWLGRLSTGTLPW
jgi:hypothetical protein